MKVKFTAFHTNNEEKQYHAEDLFTPNLNSQHEKGSTARFEMK